MHGVILSHSIIEYKVALLRIALKHNALSTGCLPSISKAYFGQFRSPNYPAEYNNNMDWNWSITVPTGYSVKVMFFDFNIEKGFDYLRIYDGPSASSLLLVTLSGHFPTPFGVTSTGSCLWLQFLTDGSVLRRGFEANFTAVNSSFLGKLSEHALIVLVIPIYVAITRGDMNSSNKPKCTAIRHPPRDQLHITKSAIHRMPPKFVHPSG